MKVADHLSKEQKQKLNKLGKSEKLSRRDLEELMGKHMDIYTRRNGAVRRK
jgi:hypothetical protein